jgi:hypothetical protein
MVNRKPSSNRFSSALRFIKADFARAKVKEKSKQDRQDIRDETTKKHPEYPVYPVLIYRILFRARSGLFQTEKLSD